ncbi:MAG: hypothetical protein AB1705_16105 [Verrucomicrobiota bacterium]
MVSSGNQMPELMNDTDMYDDKGLLTAEKLIDDLRRLRGAKCTECGAPLCGHNLLLSIALSFKNSPRCLRCLAKALQQDATETRDYICAYIQRRDCYRGAWEWACRDEGVAMKIVPACLIPGKEQDGHTARLTADAPRPDAFAETRNPDAEWDAGDLPCRELVLELRLRLNPMVPGKVLLLTARDASAPAELAAWCQLTGHILLRAEPPFFWIKRKEK